MERIVGKYMIECTEDEITLNNCHKYKFIIRTEDGCALIYRGELFFYQAKILRYSNEEKQITNIINELIDLRRRRLNILKELIE